MVLTSKGDIILSSPPHRLLLVKADSDRDGRSDGVEIDSLSSVVQETISPGRNVVSRSVDLQQSKGGFDEKFMVVYMASGPEFEKMMKNSTPEQQKKGMDAWMKWMNANKASIVEGGAPLGKTKRVDSNGASNTKNEIGGYSVVQAESHDAATKIFGKDHPHLQVPGAWIEIIEIMPVPGM
jgi:hypothetical protein